MRQIVAETVARRPRFRDDTAEANSPRSKIFRMQTLIYLAAAIAIVVVAVTLFKRMASGGDAAEFSSVGAPASPRSSEPAQAAGLRPVVDVGLCMGSGGCVTACPYRALGMVRGKAVLANPDNCLGHGVCAAACPVGAISFIPSPQAT
jgi:thioredoxin reductase (NADPH)